MWHFELDARSGDLPTEVPMSGGHFPLSPSVVKKFENGSMIHLLSLCFGYVDLKPWDKAEDCLMNGKVSLLGCIL